MLAFALDFTGLGRIRYLEYLPPQHRTIIHATVLPSMIVQEMPEAMISCGLPNSGLLRVDAVDADIHKGRIGKGGVKGIFNDSVLNASYLEEYWQYWNIARRICPDTVLPLSSQTRGRIQGAWPPEGFHSRRRLPHALQFLCIGCNGAFHSTCLPFQHEYGLGAVAAVGACYVYRVHLLIIRQGLQRGGTLSTP